MVRIFAYKKNNILSDKQWNKLMVVLSISERNKIYRFKKKSDAEISLLSRYLLRSILSSYIGIKPCELILATNKYGRPILKYPRIKNLDFNISHSGEWIVLGISHNSRVGIDIEKILPIDITIAKNYFTNQELRYLHSQKGFELENFYKIWTLKESFIKAIGDGLSYSLKDLYFKFNKDNRIQIKTKKNKGKWHFKMYNIDSDYKLAFCMNNINFPFQVQRVYNLMNISKNS